MPLACERMHQAEVTGDAGFPPTCDGVLCLQSCGRARRTCSNTLAAPCVSVAYTVVTCCGCLNNDGARRIEVPGPTGGYEQYTSPKGENESYGQPSTNRHFASRCTRVPQLEHRCSRRRRSKRAGAPRQPPRTRPVLAQAHPTAQSLSQSSSAEAVQRQHARAATQRAAHRQRRASRSADQEQRRQTPPDARESSLQLPQTDGPWVTKRSEGMAPPTPVAQTFCGSCQPGVPRGHRRANGTAQAQSTISSQESKNGATPLAHLHFRNWLQHRRSRTHARTGHGVGRQTIAQRGRTMRKSGTRIPPTMTAPPRA